MGAYLLLKKIEVQNANAIAGLTYGFPAVTNFLGFAHALSRKLPAELDVNLGGVAVCSHKNLVHARQPKGWGDYVFALTRNPLTPQGNTAPINEEGRMNMQVSLVVELKGLIAGDRSTQDQLVEHVNHILPTLRLAGGQITSIAKVTIVNNDERKLLRQLMPGFMLVDQSHYLTAHFEKLQQENPEAKLFDAWCDFSLLKMKAEKIKADENQPPENNEAYDISSSENKPEKAFWRYQPKPNSGFLVPLNIGYCAISQAYAPGIVANVRDTTVPVVFAEAAYGIGEWKSPIRFSRIEEAIWRYEYKSPWYVAKNKPFKEEITELDDDVITDIE